MDWEVFVAEREIYFGRDIEAYRGNQVYRGPIVDIVKSVKIDSVWAGEVMGYQFYTKWTLVRDISKGDDWRVLNKEKQLFCNVSITMDTVLLSPTQTHDGSIIIATKKLGAVRILPVSFNLLILNSQ